MTPFFLYTPPPPSPLLSPLYMIYDLLPLLPLFKGHHRCLLDSTNQSIILNDILVKMGVAAPTNTAAAAAATASQSMDDPYPLLSPYKGTQ